MAGGCTRQHFGYFREPAQRQEVIAMLTLFYSPVACSMASHIVLEELGIPYEARPTEILKGEHTTEAYLEINPRGRVPALDVDGKILTESVAILTYLEKRFPEKRLLTADPFDEAKCMSLMAWYASTVHPAFRHFGRPERFAKDPIAHASVKESGRSTFWACCQEIDALLKDKQWIMGNQYTVCDPYTLVFYGWFFLPERPIDLPVAELSHYTAFKDRMLERPAVRRILERERSPLLNVS
jgi:glutathione S-transferase